MTEAAQGGPAGDGLGLAAGSIIAGAMGLIWLALMVSGVATRLELDRGVEFLALFALPVTAAVCGLLYLGLTADAPKPRWRKLAKIGVVLGGLNLLAVFLLVVFFMVVRI